MLVLRRVAAMERFKVIYLIEFVEESSIRKASFGLLAKSTGILAGWVPTSLPHSWWPLSPYLLSAGPYYILEKEKNRWEEAGRILSWLQRHVSPVSPRPRLVKLRFPTNRHAVVRLGRIVSPDLLCHLWFLLHFPILLRRLRWVLVPMHSPSMVSRNPHKTSATDGHDAISRLYPQVLFDPTRPRRWLVLFVLLLNLMNVFEILLKS